MAYKRKKLDLSAIIGTDAATEIIAAGIRMSNAFILAMPAGVTVQLRFGQGGADFIDVSAPVNFELSDEEANNGLYFANPVAIPGSQVLLTVSLAKPQPNPDGLQAHPPARRGSAPPYGGVSA